MNRLLAAPAAAALVATHSHFLLSIVLLLLRERAQDNDLTNVLNCIPDVSNDSSRVYNFFGSWI